MRKQEPIREPKKTDIQKTSNLIYTILIPNKPQIKLYRALYYVSLPKPFVWSICGRIEPPLKTSRIRYQNKPKFNILCYIIPHTQNMKFQVILRYFAYDSLRVVFLRQNWELKAQANYIKISLNFTYVAISPPIYII